MEVMFMEMDNNRRGGQRVSDSTVLSDFITALIHMSMEMHMIDAMYAPTDRLTLMTMVPLRNY